MHDVMTIYYIFRAYFHTVAVSLHSSKLAVKVDDLVRRRLVQLQQEADLLHHPLKLLVTHYTV